MSPKIDTPGLLKIMVLRNKGYNVITSVHDVTIKILSLILQMWSCDQSLVTLAFL